MRNSWDDPPDLATALSKIRALHKDADGIAEVVAIGAAAIPALQQILLEREPSGLYQIRCRVAVALGLLRAFDVLEDFLRKPPSGDAIERLGDDAVVSTAARAIAQCKDDRTFALLRELAITRPLNGVITALASFKRPEAIPILINALGEDEVRSTAESALASFGCRAQRFLLQAAERFRSTNDPSESQLRKCRSILALLGEANLDLADIDQLRPFITSMDTKVSMLACRIASRSESKRARWEARARLVYLRPRVPWTDRLQIDQYLASSPID